MSNKVSNEVVEVLIIAKGRVQGVGFRWFVREKANKLGLKGYVMNLPNGDVEILAQGELERIKELMNQINVKEDYGIYVEKLIVLEQKKPKELYRGFFIRYK